MSAAPGAIMCAIATAAYRAGHELDLDTTNPTGARPAWRIPLDCRYPLQRGAAPLRYCVDPAAETHDPAPELRAVL